LFCVTNSWVNTTSRFNYVPANMTHYNLQFRRSLNWTWNPMGQRSRCAI